jgi:hypothetical protein
MCFLVSSIKGIQKKTTLYTKPLCILNLSAALTFIPAQARDLDYALSSTIA